MKAHWHPQFVITDQCASTKQAIPIAFLDATHRLCMWHITKEVKDKISDYLAHSISFKREFNKLVWNVHIGPKIFEEKWNAMMDEYGLRGHSCGECVHENDFFDAQKEMNKAVWFCGVVDILEVGDKKIYNITHKNRNSEVKAAYKVVHDIKEESFDCSCNHFVRNGILYRHAFKRVSSVELLPARARYGEMDVENQVMINQAVSMFDLIIGRVRNDKNSLAKFVDQLEQWSDEILIDVPILTGTEQKRNDIQELLCVSEPESVDFLPLTGICNKGCETTKRLVGMSERASVNAKKPKRLCRTCEKMGWHDSRNCPSKSDGSYNGSYVNAVKHVYTKQTVKPFHNNEQMYVLIRLK
ncbi:uncharacterized protein LOC112505009 [Cynara cardunculus var. scolymus]|uniref:uncharacterized protein LOC112505009 n=1 Tax=Cynara cardunculus var. scolymus TaxID=59895 RepID=UPI000D627A3E|nr:uncharacterized protein LOC112505009 [Cynara cardunculus var. scolymus]